jgi:hypothetical protein
VTPILTTRTLTSGELDGEWQIVAHGECGSWFWTPEWDRMALTWFWEKVGDGRILACQGRTPGQPADCFTLYAKLARPAVAQKRRAA